MENLKPLAISQPRQLAPCMTPGGRSRKIESSLRKAILFNLSRPHLRIIALSSTLPDAWPPAKITIDMEKPSQWVSKLCRLYFADEYAKRTVGLPSRRHVPDIAGALRAGQAILPELEVKMIEFLADHNSPNVLKSASKQLLMSPC